MPRLTLNGQELQLPVSPATWGELLARIDGELEPKGLLVTGVRLDGLDEPAFREYAVLERRLAGLAAVEVAAGTPASLLHDCLAEAVLAIGPLCDEAMRIGDQFRDYSHQAGNASLAGLCDGLASLVGIVGAAGLAQQVDLAQHTFEGRSVASMVGELSGFIEGLLVAQEAQDWITVADILQYDVEPSLRRWHPMLESLATPMA